MSLLITKSGGFIQSIVSRLNPTVHGPELIVISPVRNLKETGFLPELRKKFAL